GIGVIPWTQALIGLGIVFGTVILLNKKFGHKLGGLNGDCLGATHQLIEWVMLTYLIIISRGLIG
ncbi:MAG: adenosylcobinamide-GDP ribazoletransferase, partial [Niameybacter sp.]